MRCGAVYSRKPTYGQAGALVTTLVFCYNHVMLPSLPRRANVAAQAVVISSGIALVAALVPLLVPAGAPTQALLARQKTQETWEVIEQADVMSGATVPPNVHVVFHVPLGVTKINREILLGLKGKDVRYWGYCYPENDDAATVDKRTGLKGKLFLSEKERAVRATQARATAPRYSLGNLPTKDDVIRGSARQHAEIRHQIDFFRGGQLCYVMSEAPLAIALDSDGDRLNDRLERDLGTDELLEDTDADGILDGIEVKYGLDPTLRDTDLDGIIDGIEDANWNGLIDRGETDPRKLDTDRDELCDGQCRKKLSNGQVLYLGEDRNLNGTVDSGETSPLLPDTDGDGVFDFQEYLVCLTQGKRACK